ncbi:MAG: hypothetical protein BWY66_01260 [bacterium ADurb.Bin374]|nr:MAG: hypothetical protein BWY66_01260 [bacterium ADurb.Bin374]
MPDRKPFRGEHDLAAVISVLQEKLPAFGCHAVAVVENVVGSDLDVAPGIAVAETGGGAGIDAQLHVPVLRNPFGEILQPGIAGGIEDRRHGFLAVRPGTEFAEILHPDVVRLHIGIDVDESLDDACWGSEEPRPCFRSREGVGAVDDMKLKRVVARQAVFFVNGTDDPEEFLHKRGGIGVIDHQHLPGKLVGAHQSERSRPGSSREKEDSRQDRDRHPTAKPVHGSSLSSGASESRTPFERARAMPGW